ncbi:hypothetical protein AMS58_13840 [Pseudoalteromonas porphyrae]|uniref:Cardiolipin synthase N-terminal domain-containing protein n=1 Tax=Pseudoalteromonas porphyrae TaxID=187330 RepID=A0A0N0LZU4_9GAMM|nr:MULTISPECIES: hypothetical protein [Pseudoalteromonas]KPH63301.1 hypothetical protein ADS77_10235 [Pseudoalteromonas porphyrae]KPH94036.1 hypothetical protein AMS58_13840 [Pseudoalteromonas porphyrae]
MNINATLLGEFLVFVFIVCIPLFAWISYRLGKRKTTTPVIVAVIGGLLSIIPLFGLIYIAVLALKNDLEVKPSSV